MTASLRAVLVLAAVAALSACEKEWEFGGAYDPSGSTCNTTNPLTGACSCPTDFQTLNLAESGVTMCWSDESDAGWEWGGAFDKNSADSTCVTANPRTADCTCPSGFTELFMSEADVSVCWAGNGTQDGWQFGGAYDNASGGCNTANPQTEDCTCPGGFTTLELGEAGFALCWAG